MALYIYTANLIQFNTTLATYTADSDYVLIAAGATVGTSGKPLHPLLWVPAAGRHSRWRAALSDTKPCG